MTQPTQPILNTILQVWEGFLARLPLIGGAVLVVILTWIAAAVANRLLRQALHRAEMRASLQQLIQRLVSIAIWVGGLILAAMVVFPSLTPANALAGLGIGSVAVGFAFKDIFENFFAGILILWRFPFEEGDFIECEGIMGKVENVTIRNTLIRRVSGELVVMPNATIFKNPCEVLTDHPPRRQMVIAGVAYGEDVDAAREVIRKAVEACSTVNGDKPVDVLAREFADSSINYEVTWWTDPRPLESRQSRDQVIAAIKRALDEAGIEIPFPYRTLTFKESLHLADRPREQ